LKLISLITDAAYRYYDPKKVDMGWVEEWERRFERAKFLLPEAIKDGLEETSVSQEGRA
jgi:hypothetical protein